MFTVNGPAHIFPRKRTSEAKMIYPVLPWNPDNDFPLLKMGNHPNLLWSSVLPRAHGFVISTAGKRNKRRCMQSMNPIFCLSVSITPVLTDISFGPSPATLWSPLQCKASLPCTLQLPLTWQIHYACLMWHCLTLCHRYTNATWGTSGAHTVMEQC